MNKTPYGLIALLFLSSLTWAGSFIVVRLSYQEIDPIMLGFLRFLIATPLMILVTVFFHKPVFLPKKEFPTVLILSLTGVTLLYIFQFQGVALTTASVSSVLISTNVLLIAVFSNIFLHERFTLKKIFGILLCFSGVIVVVFSHANNQAVSFNSAFLLGCVFILISAFCWMIYSIIGKKILTRYHPLTITSNVFLVGTLLYLPFVFTSIPSVISKLSIDGWIAILYLGVFCSVFAYVAWYYALSKLEAAQSAVFLYFIPVFTILFSLFIGEKPTGVFLIGTIFILYGVYITQKETFKTISS